MPKGYWIVRVDVTQPDAFMHYATANQDALSRHGARFLARAGQHSVPEGSSRARNTIVEFPSYQAALDCWHSEGYQAARALRVGAAEMDLVIVEGYDGPQPGCNG